MLLFLTPIQAAALLECSEDEVYALLDRGELTRRPEGVAADELACLIQEREAEA